MMPEGRLLDFWGRMFPSPKGKKRARYAGEHRKYRKALKLNPRDRELQARFAKFCLMGHFTLGSVPAAHLSEALGYYRSLCRDNHFDPMLYYLVGRYYQDRDKLSSQKAYLEGIRSFNRFIEKNPGVKSDHMETAYAIALNFVTLQYDQIHPDLEKFFKAARKSYPLHTKRVKLENELTKPSPDPAKVQELARELAEIKETLRARRGPKDPGPPD
jgi:tetratricopeptide (TPR) repeat protein